MKLDIPGYEVPQIILECGVIVPRLVPKNVRLSTWRLRLATWLRRSADRVDGWMSVAYALPLNPRLDSRDSADAVLHGLPVVNHYAMVLLRERAMQSKAD